MVALTHRNTRRYGGYLVHMGIVLMFIGFTGKAFDKNMTVEVAPGETVQLGHYQLRLVGLDSGQNENYEWQKMDIAASKDGKDLGIFEPERRYYPASKQPASNVAIRRRPNEDLYMNFAGMSADNRKAVLQAYVFPLVIVHLGGILCGCFSARSFA